MNCRFNRNVLRLLPLLVAMVGFLTEAKAGTTNGTPALTRFVLELGNDTLKLTLPEPPAPRTSTADEPSLAIYSLILFNFDSPEAGPLNDRIMREYLFPGIHDSAHVRVVGSTDIIGMEDRNMKLGQQRAWTVKSSIQRNLEPGSYSSLEAVSTGEESPAYSNDLPEGRFYNRTVRVFVRNDR